MQEDVYNVSNMFESETNYKLLVWDTRLSSIENYDIPL